MYVFFSFPLSFLFGVNFRNSVCFRSSLHVYFRVCIYFSCMFSISISFWNKFWVFEMVSSFLLLYVSFHRACEHIYHSFIICFYLLLIWFIFLFTVFIFYHSFLICAYFFFKSKKRCYYINSMMGIELRPADSHPSLRTTWLYFACDVTASKNPYLTCGFGFFVFLITSYFFFLFIFNYYLFLFFLIYSLILIWAYFYFKSKKNILLLYELDGGNRTPARWLGSRA